MFFKASLRKSFNFFPEAPFLYMAFFSRFLKCYFYCTNVPLFKKHKFSDDVLCRWRGLGLPCRGGQRDSTHVRQVSLIITCRLHACSAGQLDHHLPIARMFGRSAWSSPADCTHVWQAMQIDHKLISLLDRSQPTSTYNYWRLFL